MTVNNLIPFSTYKLRLIAMNVVGVSEPSDATKEFQTIQAPPAHPPWNVTVRAMSATQLRVRWTVSINCGFGLFFSTTKTERSFELVF